MNPVSSMVTSLAASSLTAASQGGAAEAVVFWFLAPVAVLAAIGMVAVRKAVHSALLLALVMLCLAVFYLTQGAVFLGVVQIVVYTGAIMMLFLFVLMLVGVDSSDSLVETLRGQRWAAIAAGLGFGALVVAGLGRVVFPRVVGLERANAGGNVPGLAELIFTKYVWAFEVTSALLITAALGAMVLAHRERTGPRKGQRELAVERFKNFAERGGRVSPLPNPGVYARHNAVDTPALLPDGRPAENSVPGAVAARTGAGQVGGAQLRRTTHRAAAGAGAAGELGEGGGR